MQLQKRPQQNLLSGNVSSKTRFWPLVVFRVSLLSFGTFSTEPSTGSSY